PQTRVSLRFPDREVRVAHAQPGMPTALVIGARAAPVLHEKQPQVLLGGPEVLARVYRTELRIVRDALVEGVHQPAEGLLAADSLIEARRFCSRVHSWRPGYVAPCLPLRHPQRLLRVIVTRRTQFWLTIAGPAVLYATCTKALGRMCMTHTNPHNVDFTDSDSR